MPQSHGNSFQGWAKYILDRANYILERAKGYFNTFSSQSIVQISFFVFKISQMSYSWTGQVPSLVHWCRHPWQKQHFASLSKTWRPFFWSLVTPQRVATTSLRSAELINSILFPQESHLHGREGSETKENPAWQNVREDHALHRSRSHVSSHSDVTNTDDVIFCLTPQPLDHL